MPVPTARTRRPAVTIVTLALAGAVVWLTLTTGNPFPPRAISMATGPPGSAFAEFGARYREVLRRSGVDVRLVPTHGGVENLERLRDPRSGVSVAFVESGITSPERSPDLVSLGAISVEPLWLFFRSGIQVGAPGALAGKRLSIEPEGSGTRTLALRLLALNGVKDSSLRLFGFPPARAADALMRGELDGVAMLTSLRSPVVRRLLVADGVRLLGYPRADAYVALFPSLTKVVLPAGVADLARNIPPQNVPLLASEASLVVRRNLHPALHYLLLEAASEIHGGPEIFQPAGRYPAAEAVDLPLSEQARQFYHSGLPFAYRTLPLWLAGMTERFLILLIPLLVVMFPLLRLVPALYGYIVEHRIYSLYGQLRVLEREMEETERGPALQPIALALEDLSRRASHLSVPLMFSQRLFILKSHIALTRAEVEKRRRAGPADEPAAPAEERPEVGWPELPRAR
ncbi:MAG: TAXI family TRAP transporter solute-binding subunit [Gemmatimonadales bacterium]